VDHFNYTNGELFAEQVPLSAIAKKHGTPCYVYSRATIERHWRAFDSAFRNLQHLICYSVKANSNLGVLSIFSQLGSGFDIVSGGELKRVLAAGGDAKKVVFSGVGKRADEIEYAMQTGIRCFNVESESELARINAIAIARGQVAPVSIRVNPDVDANTHPYISTGLKENKFGVEQSTAINMFKSSLHMDGINLEGIDCHIGSQLTELNPFIDALDRILNMVDQISALGIAIKHIDIGGGLGIRYENETPPEPAEYAQAIAKHLRGRNLEILLEPGRAIMGNAGVLLTKVEYLKSSSLKNFAIVDAAMNDLLRPSLYKAWQRIVPIRENADGESKTYDIVGPICETGDFLGKDRELTLKEGDLLAIRSSGAYGSSMSSNYNSRPRAAEVIVDEKQIHLVRSRESHEDLFQGESVLPSTPVS